MFEILPTDWNLKPIFTEKWASVDMNWGIQPPNPLDISNPDRNTEVCVLLYTNSMIFWTVGETHQLNFIAANTIYTLWPYEVPLQCSHNSVTSISSFVIIIITITAFILHAIILTNKQNEFRHDIAVIFVLKCHKTLTIHPFDDV